MRTHACVTMTIVYMSASVTVTGCSGVAPSTSLACRQQRSARRACASLRAWAAGAPPLAPAENERIEPSGEDTVQEKEEGWEWMGLRREEMRA